jgi:hypothetical protein
MQKGAVLKVAENQFFWFRAGHGYADVAKGGEEAARPQPGLDKILPSERSVDIFSNAKRCGSNGALSREPLLKSFSGECFSLTIFSGECFSFNLA